MKIFLLLFIIVFISISGTTPSLDIPVKKLLYVATPGIRDYLGYGGHGILVFDISNGHRFVKRIPTQGLHPDKTPSNVKGIAVSIPLNSVYVSTLESLQRIDLRTDKIVWEKTYQGGCDRMSVSKDGRTIYLPSLEKNFWNVVNAETGEVIKKIEGFKRAHNTLTGLSGQSVYMADIGNPWVYVTDTKTNDVRLKVGPFSNYVRPFTVDSKEKTVFVTVDSLLGFETGDLQTGQKLNKVTVKGWNAGPVRRHGNPSHGIALTPDEKEIWLADGHNMRLHVFSAVIPYQQLTTIPLQDMPGWINFSLDGKYAYPSSGEVIETKTRKILKVLQDENYNNVASEKIIEIHFEGSKPVKAGDQFGMGRKL
jgi:DNA-binding beta-propeller fold protein YncE